MQGLVRKELVSEILYWFLYEEGLLVEENLLSDLEIESQNESWILRIVTPMWLSLIKPLIKTCKPL